MSNKGSNIDAFNALLKERTSEAIPMTLRRVVVTSVDWEAKTMDATDFIDGLEHLDIRLGLGFMNVRPAIESLALIAMIGKEQVDTLLIDCEAVEQIEFQDLTGFKLDLNEGKMTLNGDAFAGLVKGPELKKQVDKNTAILEKIQQVFNSWTPIPSDGGAALKAQVTQFTSLQRANLSDIQNENIKHG